MSIYKPIFKPTVRWRTRRHDHDSDGVGSVPCACARIAQNKSEQTEKTTEHVFIINYDLSRDVSTSLVVRRHWRTFPRRHFPAADRLIINNNIIMRILKAVYAVRFTLRTILYLGENKRKRALVSRHRNNNNSGDRKSRSLTLYGYIQRDHRRHSHAR